MKFKILDINIIGSNLQVGITHKDCVREVFGLPMESLEDNKYIDKIKEILVKREKTNKPKIDKTVIGKEFTC